MFQKNDFEIKKFKKLESKGLGESGWGGRGTMISMETIDKLIILETRTNFVILRAGKTENLQELV